MFKKALHIGVALSLVLLLMLNGISHEFLHTFAGHEDTVDMVHNDRAGSTATFEKVHHHCDFLQLQTPAFLPSFISYHFYTPVEHSDFVVRDFYASLSPRLGHTALRGPPAC
jgi:hypothetical protein